MIKSSSNKAFVSTAELAKILGISRVAIFKRIKDNKIKAFKVGRNYIIPKDELMIILGTFVSDEKKHEIDRVVKRVIGEYRETLRLLGVE